jgi:tetratricopeptide (TPR) repeat protein
VPAAGIYIATGRIAEAQRLADELSKELSRQARAYGKIIEGQIAMQQNRKGAAIDAFKEAIGLADLWLPRYARAIVENGDFVAALDELKICEDRHGEAAAIFLDDLPTLRYLAPVPYWFGRAKELQGDKKAAAEAYKMFLALRPESSKDPLAIDTRARLAR